MAPSVAPMTARKAPSQGPNRYPASGVTTTPMGSEKAMAAAEQAKLPKKVHQALAEAPHYPEGTGLRLVVNKAADLAPIRTLAEIKLAH